MWFVLTHEQLANNVKWFLSGFMWFKRLLAGLAGSDVVGADRLSEQSLFIAISAFVFIRANFLMFVYA